MNCQNCQDILQSYKDGKPTGDDLSRVREHILNCTDCRSALTAEDFVEILPVMDPMIEPSENFSSRFYAELESRTGELIEEHPVLVRERKSSWLSGWRLQLAAAGIMIVLVTAGFYFRSSPPEVDTSAVFYDLDVTENLALLQDMSLLENLDFFQDLDAIENMPQTN
jgi:hypothetical protein